MEFRLFGTTEVIDGERSIDVGSLGQRALLAILLLEAGSTVSTDRLIDALWGERPPRTAQQTVRVYVSRLRKSLEPGVGAGSSYLLTDGSGYRLAVEPREIDLRRFAALVAEAREAVHSGASDRVIDIGTAALALWRGPPLVDYEYRDFAAGEIRRLEELRLELIEMVLDARLAAGDASELIAELVVLTSANPLRQRFWGQLMIALYRTGRQADALGAFRRANEALAEAGLAPGQELVDLEDRILREDPSVLAATARSNLPASVDAFIGRRTELDELSAKVDGSRLVTVTGPGGGGKSRLVQEMSTRLLTSFRDGVWFVDLASVVEPGDIEAAVPAVLPRTWFPAGRATLAGALQDRSALLVLDNCEHVLDVVAPLVETVLTTCPKIQIVATSRQPLRVRGEVVYRIPPLGLPREGVTDAETARRSDAVGLFEERLRAADPGFELTDANARAVVEIVLRLDGMPLAIELAAVRSAGLSEIEVSRRLGEILPLLGPGTRTVLPRHRTMEAALEWSYLLLDSDEQGLFRCLSVMRDAFSGEDAAAVIGPLATSRDTLELLASLVDKSMLVRTPSLASLRFRLLEPLRQYGSSLLDAENGVTGAQQRRDDHFWAVAVEMASGFRLFDRVDWVDRFENDLTHLLLSIGDRRARGDLREAAEVVLGLGGFFLASGRYQQGAAALGQALDDVAGADPKLETELLGALAGMLRHGGEFRRGLEAIETALATAMEHEWEPMVAGRLQNMLGILVAEQGDVRGAVAHFRSAAGIYESAAPRETTIPLVNLAYVQAVTGDTDEARATIQRIRQSDEAADRRAFVEVLDGVAARVDGELETADRRLTSALRSFEQRPSAFHVSLSLVEQGRVQFELGNLERAESLVVEAFATVDVTPLHVRLLGLNLMASIALHRAQIHDAALLLSTACDESEAAGASRPPGGTVDIAALLASANRREHDAAVLLGISTAVRSASGEARSPQEEARIEALGSLRDERPEDVDRGTRLGEEDVYRELGRILEALATDDARERPG